MHAHRPHGVSTATNVVASVAHHEAPSLFPLSAVVHVVGVVPPCTNGNAHGVPSAANVSHALVHSAGSPVTQLAAWVLCSRSSQSRPTCASRFGPPASAPPSRRVLFRGRAARRKEGGGAGTDGAAERWGGVSHLSFAQDQP